MDGESGGDGAGRPIGEWNDKSRKENGQDVVDRMKQEVYSKDRVMRKEWSMILREDESGRVMVMMDEDERVRPGGWTENSRYASQQSAYCL